MTKVGLIGAGAMGEPMAASLIRAGFVVAVCAHRNRAPVERLVVAGGHGRDDYSAVATFYQDATGVDAAEKA